MKSYNKGEMFGEFCKLNNKFGLYLSYTFNEKMENIIDELKKSVPWLNEEDLASFFFEDSLVFLFDSEDEMNEKFSQVYGEDRYTELDYDERLSVYALTCDNNGEFMNENT